MGYTREEGEGRALAYAGSILFSALLAPFAATAFCVRETVRAIRDRGVEGWQLQSARVVSGNVTAVHGRFIDYAIGTLGYAYSISDAYYSGFLSKQFWNEQHAWSFVDSFQNRPLMIRYKPGKPQRSVLRLSDSAPSGFADDAQPISRKQLFGPWLAILWSLRNVSAWALKELEKEAVDWPSADATVEYAEPMIAGNDGNAHWVGDLHYTYSVDGRKYSGARYYPAYDADDATQQVKAWRGKRLSVRYFRGKPQRSVLISDEQDTSPT